ncbi:hypothetical protein L917_09193 [Phytophthora nicotianae]|uniref:HAT C-terminal dimerisation domain-containing protein n=3 Tax=Phytophthora nicotianae TaxID=4792 RepID=V9F3B0_PHYNI|nr:hypothetical protein F443_09560 [Phytophthora nicotianae P1569]ETK85966.1 hypothetical protein L915_09353 [Phytophthora nicotianae]ETL39391.1 hypothetical protein L916_09259 [Phytophthora nicotianae]ETL92513.1 hypothetical protein L917_09193 [Phytophthora nicotianae]
MGVAFLLDHTQRFVDYDLDSTLADLLKIASPLGCEDRQIGFLRGEIGQFIVMKEEWTAEEREQHGQYSPSSWWGTHIKMFPNLPKIAWRVFCVSTSSAASEITWSIHDYIQSKRRNRFSLETVMMLVFIYTNMADKGPTTSSLFTTPWLNNDGVEASEDELGVGDLIQDEAAVADELYFGSEEEDQRLQYCSDSDASSTDSSRSSRS